MLDMTPNIKSLGESAVVVEFGNEISEALNDAAISLSNELNSRPFSGMVEAFPSYSSTTVFYDAIEVRRRFTDFDNAFSAVSFILDQRLSSLAVCSSISASTIEVPVDFSAKCGLDLENIAVGCGLTVEEVIELFTARIYRVYMIGFLPGFAYMGEVDERIWQPRKHQPRLKVPKGSVGIAGAQAGVYPLDTPGGWQIIGRTEIEFFQPFAKEPSLLKPGELVKFVAV